MTTRIIFYNDQGDLFELLFLHEGNSHWTIGQLLKAVRPRLQMAGINVDRGLIFLINRNALYDDSDLVTSFDIKGRILVDVDEKRRPTFHPHVLGKTSKRKNKSRRPKYEL
jgi:hypothetical protein